MTRSNQSPRTDLGQKNKNNSLHFASASTFAAAFMLYFLCFLCMLLLTATLHRKIFMTTAQTDSQRENPLWGKPFTHNCCFNAKCVDIVP